MSLNQILELPYVCFVVGMLDAPRADYEASKTDKNKTPKKKKAIKKKLSKEEELNVIANALR